MEEIRNLNLFQKLAAISAEITRVGKNLSIQAGKDSYKAVGEGDVLAAVKPLEEKYGIYSFPAKREIVGTDTFTKTSTYNGQTKESTTLFMRIKTTYRFVNIDNPAEFVEIDTYGDGVDTQDKAPGKAMTYADKYALLKAYKITTGDDPDQHGSEDMGRGKNTQIGVPCARNRPSSEQNFKPMTIEQKEILQDYGTDFDKLVKYYKHSTIEQLTFDEAQEAIVKKQKAAQKAEKEAALEAEAQQIFPRASVVSDD